MASDALAADGRGWFICHRADGTIATNIPADWTEIALTTNRTEQVTTRWWRRYGDDPRDEIGFAADEGFPEIAEILEGLDHMAVMCRDFGSEWMADGVLQVPGHQML